MPNLSPYLLAFTSGLHIGTRGVNLEEAGLSIPADTLFAAILDVWSRTGGDVDDFVAPFTGPTPNPPFLLSSAFPYAGQVRFYPLPANLSSILQKETLKAYGKKLKRVIYFSEGLLKKALNGEMLDPWLFPKEDDAEPTTGVALQNRAFWLLVDEIALLPPDFQRPPGKRRAMQYLRAWKRDLAPHVTVDRANSASIIHHSGRVIFAPGCGLWFGLSWLQAEAALTKSKQSYPEALEATLGWLQDDGLGGERSTGAGAFELQKATEVQFPDPKPGEAAYLLNRYHPRADELPSALNHPQAAYQFEAVGGWLHSYQGASQRRKRLYLVQEGSLVCPPGYPAGDLVDVRPTFDNPAGDLTHPVYRSGFALAVGWPSTIREATDA